VNARTDLEGGPAHSVGGRRRAMAVRGITWV
jgi:hypothetical protein